ncbi:TPA: GIY-YIG nuclease family protein [Bacillus cereus]|uniref:GIY-YIG nuclease family protein n=1 Tax=Bacillus TaxID=1386 RepID=UPI00077AADA5|nr:MULTISPECIES: GIY-YIG nuclease family protein [Bacillus]KXY95145.1 hypothetical protein AT279_21745 [Bacillus cereus]MCU5253461.1 GIY-YIG nuclease family protein [Bacillus cereus]MEC2500857.1 GIY-YIG nuclease family protein [Bacillus cereus]SDJ70314.1 group I intron endonuclease [Bacillus sp. cl96]SEB14998.1 group I intron endonuclease [Bacillus sp. cl115]
MIGIYKITNKSNGKFYIGQSTNIKQRFKNHKEAINRKPDDKRGHGPLYDDMREFGLDCFSFEVLELCDVEALDEKEEYYINLYDAVNQGYNRSKTAIATNDEDVMKKIITPAFIDKQRKRFSEMNNKNWKDPEYREKMSKKSSELQKKRLENPEYLAEKSAVLKKATDKMKKRVAQYTLDGELVAIHEGLRVAERATGIRSIDKHLKHPDKRKQAGGFVWKYVDQN